jgi:hypothetical protein
VYRVAQVHRVFKAHKELLVLKVFRAHKVLLVYKVKLEVKDHKEILVHRV